MQEWKQLKHKKLMNSAQTVYADIATTKNASNFSNRKKALT
jgi:hypothetical protein